MNYAADPVPDGALLLHIGVPKTGTTGLQDSLAASRDRLDTAGVCYPGHLTEHSRAALSVLGLIWGWRDHGGGTVQDRWWPELLDQVRSAPGRVLVSSEFFCEANEEQAATIADALGRSRLHVVVTLRPLGRLLPSSWQQYLKTGVARSYPGWLKAVLADQPTPGVTPSFWRRHDHGAVVQRWVDELGPDRVTVVVLDRTDHAFLPRCFEGLLALPDGMLEPRPDARSNRSLTLGEAELLRRVNRAVRREGLDWRSYERLLRRGAVLRLVEQREPGPAEARIVTPAWALERAAELGQVAVQRIRASGATVLGGLDSLAADHGSPGDPGRIVTLPIDVAAQALVGTAMAGAADDSAKGPMSASLEKRLVQELTARDLARALRARAGGRLTRRRRR